MYIQVRCVCLVFLNAYNFSFTKLSPYYVDAKSQVYVITSHLKFKLNPKRQLKLHSVTTKARPTFENIARSIIYGEVFIIK